MSEGIVFDIQRFSVHDGPGIRTTVFLKGCPLRCLWCHNPESWEIEPQEIIVQKEEVKECITIGRYITAQEVMEVVLRDKVFYDTGGGISISGGEPLLQPAFTKQIFILAKQAGIHTCLDTSGYGRWEDLQNILMYTDLVLFDFKVVDAKKHREFTGADNELIKNNLINTARAGNPIIIRVPIIPSYNDSDEDFLRMSDFIRGLPNILEINLLPYNELSKAKYERLGFDYKLRQISTADSRTREGCSILEKAGFKVNVY